MKRFFILKKKFVFNSPTLDELCISLKTAEKMRGALPKLAFDEGISIRCSEKMSYNTYKRRKCKHEKIILKHIIFSFWDLLFDIHYSKTSPYMIFWQEKNHVSQKSWYMWFLCHHTAYSTYSYLLTPWVRRPFLFGYIVLYKLYITAIA